MKQISGFLLFLLIIVSCSPPVSPVSGQNEPPWPVTGPDDLQELTLGILSFDLVISDDMGIVSDPHQYDPDGNTVSFTAVLSRLFTGTGADPVVTISGDGHFSVDWDPDLAGYYAYYTVVSSDGTLQTSSTVEIPIYFY